MSNLSELLIRSQKHQEKSNNYRQIDSQTNLARGREPSTLNNNNTNTRNISDLDTDTTDVYTPALGLSQAEAWATKALDISMRAREERKKRKQDSDPTCEVAFAVVLFNIAALRRVSHPFLCFLFCLRYCCCTFLVPDSFFPIFCLP